MSLTFKTLFAHVNSDMALGAVGTGLAAASVTFGVYMTIHGPVASFGHSKDFTVFAQFKAMQRTPHYIVPADDVPNPVKPYRSRPDSDDLDTTATASIPAANGEGPLIGANTTILQGFAVRAATRDTAEIVYGGREQTVHLGDTLADAGEVLEIWPGRRPTVRTSYGLIISHGP